MARNEVDVIIGAKTDDASFRDTEQKTKGFLQRLRGGGGRSGEGTEALLQRTARAQETLSKVVAAAAVLKEGMAAFNASLDIAKGLSAGIAGDMEAMDNAILKARDSLSQSLVGSAGLTLGELIFGDQADADEINEAAARQQRANDAAHARALQRTKDLARIREQSAKAVKSLERDLLLDQMTDQEREVFLLNERLHARGENLAAMLKELEALSEFLDVSKEIETVQKAITQSWVDQQEQVKALRAEFDRINQKAAQDAVQSILDFFSTSGPTEEAKQAVPFRAALPGLTQGLLLSGQAAAAQTKSAETIRRQQAAENTEKNTADTVSVLRELLDATRGQAAPVLN